MGEVIVVASGKGGSGKTTVTAALSCSLAMRGKRVIAVDADIGLRNLDLALGLSDRTVFDFLDVINGRCALEKASVCHPLLPSLSLLAAPQLSCGELVRVFTPETAYGIRAVCAELSRQYDYVFVDSPAGIGQGLLLAAAGAASALLVVTPDLASVRDADQAAEVLSSIGVERQRLIVNRVRPPLIKKGGAMNIDDVIDAVSVQLMGIIPEDESVTEALNAGRPLCMGKSPAARAAANIARRLCGERVELLKLR